MTLQEKFDTMVKTFETEDLSMLGSLLVHAADYIQSVTVMLAENRNYFDRSDEDLRSHKQKADKTRRSNHDAFIIEANTVNKLCALYQLPPFYEGPAYLETDPIEVRKVARRAYGDFAMALTQLMFTSR